MTRINKLSRAALEGSATLVANRSCVRHVPCCRLGRAEGRKFPRWIHLDVSGTCDLGRSAPTSLPDSDGIEDMSLGCPLPWDARCKVENMADEDTAYLRLALQQVVNGGIQLRNTKEAQGATTASLVTDCKRQATVRLLGDECKRQAGRGRSNKWNRGLVTSQSTMRWLHSAAMPADAFRVPRLTLQTRKPWLVGVATDRDAPLACREWKNHAKMWRNASKNTCKERQVKKGKIFKQRKMENNPASSRTKKKHHK